MKSGRSDRRTGGRVLCLAAFLLTACPPDRLTAQLSLHASAGVRSTSTLVHDSIVTAFDVRPALGPALALTGAIPLQGGWAATATVDLSWAGLERHDRSGPSVDLGHLTTIAFAVGLERRLADWLSARAGLGGLKYFPADETGIFRLGSGSVAGLGLLAVAYDRKVGARHSLGLEARYDLHRFITPALRSEGFTDARAVHRLALAVRAGWGAAP